MGKKRYLDDRFSRQDSLTSDLGKTTHRQDGPEGLGFYTPDGDSYKPEGIPSTSPEESVLTKLDALNRMADSDSVSAADYKRILDIYSEIQAELGDPSKEPDYAALEERLNRFSEELYTKTTSKEDSARVVEPAVEPSARVLHETANRLYDVAVKREPEAPSLKSVQDRLRTMQEALDGMDKEEEEELRKRREKLETDEAGLAERQRRRREAFQKGMQQVLDGMKVMAEAMGEEEQPLAA